MESFFSSGFFLLKKEKQAKEKRDCRSAGKAWNSLFHLILLAKKRKAGKRKKNLPFGREAWNSLFHLVSFC
ncbi:hypothetical protein [Ruminococcus sp.]|uniref:hypothetical protein n=1 Tax=Ruminococcus sp. TaxID=41978 RepID=UPI002EA80E69|nr:hypothetical protein [Ruminococcus sp.]